MFAKIKQFVVNNIGALLVMAATFTAVSWTIAYEIHESTPISNEEIKVLLDGPQCVAELVNRRLRFGDSVIDNSTVIFFKNYCDKLTSPELIRQREVLKGLS